MKKEELLKLHTNQRLLLEELLSRGVELTPIVKELELFEATYGNHTELILDRDTRIVSYAASVITSDKSPKGAQFFFDQRDLAIQFAEALGWPVVLKPVAGSHGRGCTMGILSTETLEQVLDEFVAEFGSDRPFLIEAEAQGEEYRIFITERGKFAVLHRMPASVVGDGVNTIGALAKSESDRRMNPRINCLCPISIDRTVERYLAAQGFSLNSVPANGVKVTLRATSNLAQGGSCEDVTGIAHPQFVSIAAAILRIFPGLAYAGIDIVTKNISKNPNEERYAVLEVNSNPGIHMHMRPALGKAQNVAAYIADLIFPETCKNE
jgi:cyanophycin synthetase